MKKVIYCTTHPAPYIDNIIDGLKESYDIEVWCCKEKSATKEWRDYIPTGYTLISRSTFLKNLSYIKHADFVILPWGVKIFMFLGCILSLFNVKYAYFLDHPIPSQTRTSLISKLIKRFLLHQANAIFPACYSCLNYLYSTYKIEKEKLQIFPYMYSPPPLNIDELNQNRERNIVTGEKPTLLIANRFIDRKGYDIVLKAFECLDNDDILKKYKIIIVGDGKEFKSFRTKFLQLDPNIKFLGWIENEEYEQYLNSCDIFLHASKFEPFGIPPLDAMMRNKFVITSDGVQSTNLVFTNESGCAKYPASNYIELYRILKNLIGKDLYEKTKNNALKCQEYYSIKVNKNSINKIIG